jgi:hypothetical protein
MQKLLFKLSMEHLGKLVWGQLLSHDSKIGSNSTLKLLCEMQQKLLLEHLRKLL